MEDWVRNRGRENGCVIVLERSKKNGVDLACNRGGEPKLKATVRRTGSVKKNCPFKLKGRYDGRGRCWRLEVENETHNHDPVGFEEGHSRLRKLTDEQFDMVAMLYRSGVRPAEIHRAVRDHFPESRCIQKDIYNALAKIKNQTKIGDTPMKVLEKLCEFSI